MFILDTSTGKIVTNAKLPEPKASTVYQANCSTLCHSGTALIDGQSAAAFPLCELPAAYTAHQAASGIHTSAGTPVVTHSTVSCKPPALTRKEPVACPAAAHQGHRMEPSYDRAQLHVCNSGRHGHTPVGSQPVQRSGKHTHAHAGIGVNFCRLQRWV